MAAVFDTPMRPVGERAEEPSSSSSTRGAAVKEASPPPAAAAFDTPLRPVGPPGDNGANDADASSGSTKSIIPSWMTKVLLQSGPAEMAFSSDATTQRRALSSSEEVDSIKDTIKSLKKEIKKREKAYKKADTREQRSVIQDMIRVDEGLLADAERRLAQALEDVDAATVAYRTPSADSDIVKQLERVRDDLNEIGVVEQFPKLEGRQMVMVVAPK